MATVEQTKDKEEKAISVGFVFGKLKVISQVSGNRKLLLKRWICECECGNVVTLNQDRLLKGYSVSCGCQKKSRLGIESTTHGVTAMGKPYAPEYRSWDSMIQRCTNPNNKKFFRYGMRGITICDRWIHNYPNFLADMGKKPTPKHTLGRIDNNGNYEPSNCRWETKKEQNENTSRNVWLEYNGEKKIIRDWATYLGMKYSNLQGQLKRKSLTEIIEKRLQKQS